MSLVTALFFPMLIIKNSIVMIKRPELARPWIWWVGVRLPLVALVVVMTSTWLRSSIPFAEWRQLIAVVLAVFVLGPVLGFISLFIKQKESPEIRRRFDNSEGLVKCIERILLNYRDLIYEEVEDDEVMIRRNRTGEIRDEDIVGCFLKDEFDARKFDEMYIRRRIDEWIKENQRRPTSS
jgi:hypothetical protein